MGSSSPLMMVDMLSKKFYSLGEKKLVNLGYGGGTGMEDGVTVVGSSHGWLVLFNKSSHVLFLWNPISCERVNLPSIDNLEDGHGFVHKVIVSSSSLSNEWRAVMSYGFGDRLAFCCPGQSKTEWTRLTLKDYGDFAYSSRLNRLLCVTRFGGVLERWDLRDPLSPKIDCSKEEEKKEEEYRYHDMDNFKYMVVAEKSNEIFLVVRKVVSGIVRADVGLNNLRKLPYCGGEESYKDELYFKTIGFKVYKIIMDGTKMSSSYMEGGSLNGLAMFVGINHSFALPAAEYPGLNPDSIYFTDPGSWYHPLALLLLNTAMEVMKLASSTIKPTHLVHVIIPITSKL